MTNTGSTGIVAHLFDGTWELFRCYFGPPPVKAPDGREVGATRALMRSLWSLFRNAKVTHAAVAFDDPIESFRNDLYPGYKTGAGVDPDLLGQFELARRATRALGIVTWKMEELEADDGIASAAARLADDPRVAQVRICANDKDLAQCVRGTRVVMYDRFKDVVTDEDGVRAKYGVPPPSIADWLALVGDSADGYPGLRGWGAKSAAAVVARYGRIEDIPPLEMKWDIAVRGAASLGARLREQRDDAMLFKRLATLRTDADIDASLETLAWRGPDIALLEALCAEIGDRTMLDRVREDRAIG